jgi:hypothetical protein
MSVTGKVKNGVVVLPTEMKLPDGTEVEITPLLSAKEAEDFTDELLRISRTTKDLPPDLAKNHDHYLHGLPRK